MDTIAELINKAHIERKFAVQSKHQRTKDERYKKAQEYLDLAAKLKKKLGEQKNA